MKIAPQHPGRSSLLAVLTIVTGPTLAMNGNALATGTTGGIPFIEPDQTFELDMSYLTLSVAIGGDWATLRGPTGDEITLFHRDSAGLWSAHSTIPVPSPTPTVRPVVIRDDLMLVGRPELAGGGLVQVFSLHDDGPVELAPIVNPTPSEPAFGYRLAFDGVTLLVGYETDGSTPWAFERRTDGTWSLQGQFPLPPLPVGTSFGAPMAVGGSVAVLGEVSAASMTTPSLLVGRLHIYERHRDGRWAYSMSVSGFDSAPSSSFGSSIGVSDDVIAAGSPSWPDARGEPRGAVFIVERDARGIWDVTLRIDAPVDVVEGRFGLNTVLRGNRLTTFDRIPNYLSPIPMQFSTFVRNERGDWVPGVRMAVPLPSPVLGAYQNGTTTASDGMSLLVLKRLGFSQTISFLNDAFDCNGNGVEDALEIDAGLVDDCNLNRRPDSCDAAAGRLNGDGDGLLDYCETDCNGNGIPDGEDLATGVVGDCNGNGIPDTCEIAFKLATDHDGDGAPDDCQPDCNENGVPDAFEIATGAAADCDGNGVPDTCGTMFGHADFSYIVFGYTDAIWSAPGLLIAARYQVEPGQELISKVVFAVSGLDSPATLYPGCLPNHVPVSVALCADNGIPGPEGMTVLWSTSFVTGEMVEGPGVYECKLPPISPGPAGADFYVVVRMMHPEACVTPDRFLPMPLGICESDLQPYCDMKWYAAVVTDTSPPFEEHVEAGWWTEQANYLPYLHAFGVPCISAAADLTGDGIVDGTDISALFGAWGECAQTGQCDADLNTDGAVDGNDLAMVLGAWSQ